MGNEFDNKCGFMSDPVSYLYGEMPAEERTAFEDHLSGCDECTDEFAAISFSRLSVMEWQRGEFAHLPTPEIVIPYEAARSNSWIGSIRGMFALPGFGPAMAAAVVLLIVGGMYFGFYSGAGKEQPVAVSAPKQNVAEPIVNSVEPRPIAPAAEPEPAPVTISQEGSPERSPRPVRAKITQRAQKVNRPLTADLDEKAKPAVPVQKAPVLSNFDDDEDNSLRLADLIEDGGV